MHQFWVWFSCFWSHLKMSKNELWVVARLPQSQRSEKIFQKTLILAFEANSALSHENKTKIVKITHSASFGYRYLLEKVFATSVSVFFLFLAGPRANCYVTNKTWLYLHSSTRIASNGSTYSMGCVISLYLQPTAWCLRFHPPACLPMPAKVVLLFTLSKKRLQFLFCQQSYQSKEQLV